MFLIVPSPTEGASFNSHLGWETVETRHFAIHSYKGEEEVVEQLTSFIEDVYGVLSQKFDARPWGKTEVVVTDTYDQANGFTTVIPYNLVILRVVPPSSESALANYDEWLRELFVHEYTHVLHLSDTRYPAKLLKNIFGKIVAPNGLTPGWVMEGLATYFESSETSGGRGKSSFTDMLLRTDILRGKFLHLDQMAGTQYEWPSWMAQYLYGVGFWNYLSQNYGEEKLTEFSHKYGASLWFFSLNNKAKRVFGKSFYQLWKDWKNSLEIRYTSVKSKVEQKGLSEGFSFLQPQKGESFSYPTISSDGKQLAYLSTSIHHFQELRLRNLETGKEKVVLKKKEVQQMSFSPDGQSLVISYVDTYKRYYSYADLYEISLAPSPLAGEGGGEGKIKQLTKGLRARDPDYSPDGKKIVAHLQETGFAWLGVYDRGKGEWNKIVRADQFDNPRWLPDGKSVVVSVHREGQRDLEIIDTESKKEKRITSNTAMESRPWVDAENHAIYYSSDVSGISNIYRYDLQNKKVAQVTNVLTGAFAPSVLSDGSVVFQYYNGSGYELRKLEGQGEMSSRGPVEDRDVAISQINSGDGHASLAMTSEPYHPFKRLFIPRSIFPNAALLDNSVFLSAIVTNFDPLNRHIWFVDGNYRSDNNFFGYNLGYTYNRFRIPFSAGYGDNAVNYGNVFGTGVKYFEERKRTYAGWSFPWSAQRLNVNYFFENRSALSGLPAGTTLSTLGHYSGVFAQYVYGKTSGTAAGISPEEGERVTLNFELSNKALGASTGLQQRVAWGEAKTYLHMPYARHHVLAFKAAGGASFGDPFLQGNFGLGGSIGESPFTGTSTRVFTLRGLPLVTFASDHAWVASVEYRVPLFRLQRGLGTLPLAVNSTHFAIFADVGDAFNRGFSSFRPLLGVGGELRADFIIGYHLPVMGRLGYGILVTNRNRIAGVKDVLTGADARNGVIVLELGTSF